MNKNNKKQNGIIDLKKLKYAVNEILDSMIKNNHLGIIELQHDFYWDFLKLESLYDPTKDPSDFGLGQLYDDWEFVQSVIESMEEDPEDESARDPIMLMHIWPLIRYFYDRSIMNTSDYHKKQLS